MLFGAGVTRALATTRVPADTPTDKLVDVLVDMECTLTALYSHVDPPNVSELRRHGTPRRVDAEAR